MRKKLEEEYLADSLKGRIKYFLTHYRKAHDATSRVAIRLDGEEILCGNWFQSARYGWPLLNDELMDLGAFDQGSFNRAFQEFDNQSIEQSLESEDLLVRILAILDRRIGKRRLLQMKETIQDEAINFQTFFAIRMEAEELS